MPIITIAGYPGAGKGTVGKLLSKRLKYKFLSVGDFRRDMAKKMNISIHELNKIGEKDKNTDTIADNYQIELGKTADNFIFEGRLSWYFIPDSTKVFLDVNKKTGAERILKAKRKTETSKTLEEQIEKNKKRCKSDVKRYSSIYNIKDCFDKNNFDIIIDTSHKTPEEVVDEILIQLS